MIGRRYPALESTFAEFMGSVSHTSRSLCEPLCSLFNYQTTRRAGGEIPVGVSFRQPYRKGPTCSHPEHRSQAFRADDSAYQRESRYCRIFKKPFGVLTSKGFFCASPPRSTSACRELPRGCGGDGRDRTHSELLSSVSEAQRYQACSIDLLSMSILTRSDEDCPFGLLCYFPGLGWSLR